MVVEKSLFSTSVNGFCGGGEKAGFGVIDAGQRGRNLDGDIFKWARREHQISCAPNGAWTQRRSISPDGLDKRVSEYGWSASLYGEVRSCIAKLQVEHGLEGFVKIATQSIRELTGFDRVLAYKFLSDGSRHRSGRGAKG